MKTLPEGSRTLSAAGHIQKPAVDRDGALVYSELSAHPVLVLMAGHPGSGKSTLAQALGRTLAWPVLDKDTVKSTLMEALPSGFERTAVEVDLDLLAYDLLHSLVVDLFAQQRLSVILDTPALRAGIVQRATELVHSSGGTLKVILCRTDLETRNERLLQRAAKSSHRTMHTIETDVDKHFGHLPPRTLIIQTDRPLSDLVAEAMLYLQA